MTTMTLPFDRLQKRKPPGRRLYMLDVSGVKDLPFLIS